MAIVQEASGNGPIGAGVDNKLTGSNRSVAAGHGTATPEYVGEIVTDLSNDTNMIARREDPTSTSALGTSDWGHSNKQ